MKPSLTIDCNTCTMQHTSACDDCMVTYLCSEHTSDEPPGAVIIDLAELRTAKMLAEAGLVPELRHTSDG
ncbi:MAG: hypothetical protein HKN26_05690 [Acidimicrobiales bacterium]|nr:hypothetical protein [Acidimicrobiales bacterium]